MIFSPTNFYQNQHCYQRDFMIPIKAIDLIIDIENIWAGFGTNKRVSFFY